MSLIKTLPLRVTRMINSAYFESYALTYAPLLVPIITQQPTSFPKKLCQIVSRLIKNHINFKSNDRTLPSFLITNNNPIYLKVMKIGLNYLHDHQHSIYNYLTQHQPHLIPPVNNDNRITRNRWLKTTMQDITKKLLKSHSYAGENSHLFLNYEMNTSFQKLNHHTRLLLGAYDFWIKNKTCLCNHHNPDSIHLIFHCERLNKIRAWTTDKAKIFNMTLIGCILKRPKISYKLLQSAMDQMEEIELLNDLI